MNNSMITASSSMGALQRKLDILADNIANVNTVGYKRKTAVFEDLLTSLQPHEQDFRRPGRQTPMGFGQGWGAKLTSTHLDLSQGSLLATGNMSDVALEGNGMFAVRMPDQTQAYTRHGPFHLVPDGTAGDRKLVTADGLSVLDDAGGEIIVPAGRELQIAEDGTLSGVRADGSAPQTLGRISLFTVEKPELVRVIGENLYGIDADMLQAGVVRPVTQGVTVRQGFTEQSNVDMTQEMSDLMMVQRAYQLSARALSSGEQMLGMANNLRG